ncbi:MAG: N-acetyl-gamma-glutamyl-phosphate reductase [Alphaproteobacteria bacterium]|nr:N-acetyl-gamma-glutamyl-phosphate reductase [Alphaproteobacteria bacterium]MBV9695177.1 N-acetyl-gamma-glutamyl-phosphate reductase [Alphaproteobacteria bacterium]
MGTSIFIDGAAGTTGLEIRARLAGRGEFGLRELSDAERKDGRARAAALNEADIVILCLPDQAAREAVAMIENPAVRVIDASSAHRAAAGWVYGFAELEKDRRAELAAAKRVSNPGCWPTGFLALVRPLVRAGIVPADFPLTVSGVSGYSGGGKSMIEEFEAKQSPRYVDTVVRTYALTLSHKHLPEMRAHAGLAHPPVFSANVGRFYRGMIVEVPLQLWALPSKPGVFDVYREIEGAYRGEKLIEVAALGDLVGTVRQAASGTQLSAPPQSLDAEMLKHTNGMKLFVFGNDMTQQARLIAVLDNLGKGASGAAVQNLNIMLGLPETAGLV